MSILYKFSFHLILMMLLFSVWAAFALFVINPNFSNDLPRYTVGRLCIWEAIAGIAAFVVARITIGKWGYPGTREINGKKFILINKNYVWIFLIYFFIVLGIGIWQFIEFSRGF